MSAYIVRRKSSHLVVRPIVILYDNRDDDNAVVHATEARIC